MKNNNDMKSRRLFDAIDGIGDDLINEAADYSSVSRKSLFLKIGTAAASFLIVAAVVLSIIIGGKQESVVKEKVPINFSESDNVMYTGARNSLPEGLRNVCVYAEGTDGKIIPTGEKLIVRTDETCDADLVAEYINVSPKTDYSITKTAPGEFALAPSSGSFFPGTVYNISFGDPENPSASYTFQTETEFFVKSVLPADMATDVPVNTGIEITFSEPIDTSELEKYITVDPEVKLDFKLYPNGKVLAAVPEDPLEYGKIYTVTMAKGLVSSSGRELAQDKVFSFRTSYGEEDDKTNTRLYISLSPLNAAQTFSYRYSSSREFIYSPDEEAAVSFELYNYYDLIAGKVSAELYRYPDADKAASAIIAGSSAFPEGDGLSEEGLIKIGEYKAADLDGNSDGLEGSVSFGTGLDKGIYLAKITAKAKNRFSDNLTSAKYVVIQITDLRAFTISSDGLTLLRVDDLKRGAVSGAEVSSVSFDRKTWRDDGEIGTSNDSAIAENGICTIKTDGKNAAVITVKNGDDALIVCSVCNEEEDGKYVMSYLYTDREKYFSSDTVNFSGFAVGINGSIPSALYVKTADTPAEQIEVGKNGYFSGSLSFEDRAEGGFFITVSDAEGNTVASKYISVTEEQKPQITAKIEFDKLFYRYGERVTVTLKATFFDGTPAEGFDFTLSSYPFDGDTYATYTTDKNGEAVYTFDTGYVSDPWSTDPSTIWVYAELSGFESQTLNVSESVYYFHSDFVFKTVWETNRRALTLNKVDTSKIKTEEDLARDVFPENTVGEPAEGSVSYVLKKYEIIKTEKTEYDYYTKRTYKYYDYRTEESTVDSGTLSFENGVIELPMKKVEGFVGGYYYEIFYNDGRNTYEEYISATESSYIRRNGSANEITISLDKEKYGAGDDFTASFLMNGAPLDDALFAVYANGLEKYGQGAEYTDKFDGTMITGAVIYAVSFDSDAGAYFYRSMNIPFDPAGSKLEVEITPDKDVYSPGERATVKIKVKDAPGAAVTLSIVDEACFALEDQDEDSAEKYFTSVKKLEKEEYNYYYGWYGYRNYYSSTMKPVSVNSRFDSSESLFGEDAVYNTGGMKFSSSAETATADAEYVAEDSAATGFGLGEEDSFYVRTYFADNPLFELTELDENGEATVVFNVPDNITSWRITAVAADGADTDFDKVRLGNAVSDVICTQGFFINLSAPSYYIKGDDASLLARSFGISADGEVEYTAKLTDEDGNEISAASASDDSKGYAELNFGKLDVGHYTATVYAKCGDEKDALTSEFDVVLSGEMMRERRTVTPDEIKNIKPALYPVTLSFYDSDTHRYFYNSVLFDLSFGDGSARADALAAEYAALKASDRLFGTDSSERLDAIKDTFSNYCGDLISLLTYSEGDVELTAKILASCSDLLTAGQKEAIISYLEDSLSSDTQPDEVTLCSSLASLAELGEPILDVLYRTAEESGNYPTDAKLYLACAFASLGDWSAADDIYSQIKDEIGDADSEYSTLCLRGENDDETLRLTALAVYTATKTNRDDAEALARYIYENPSLTEFSNTALAAYVSCFTPDGEYAEKTFTYSINGEEHTETLKVWGTVNIKLSKSALESFELVSADEGVAVDASYLAPSHEVLKNYDISDRVTVTKNIKHYKNGLYKVTINVSGTSDRVSEFFDISDAVPSGARYFSSYNDTSSYDHSGNIHTGAYVYNTAGQKISGSVWIFNDCYSGWDIYKTECPEYSFSVSVSYVIRGAVKGEFIAESAVVRNLAADVYSASERLSVTITDGDWLIK